MTVPEIYQLGLKTGLRAQTVSFFEPRVIATRGIYAKAMDIYRAVASAFGQAMRPIMRLTHSTLRRWCLSTTTLVAAWAMLPAISMLP